MKRNKPGLANARGKSKSGTHRAARALAISALIITAISAQARADDSESAWCGAYKSRALDKVISVCMVVPAKDQPGELRFQNVPCAVGLVARAAYPAGIYHIVKKKDEASGAYCASFINGDVETRPKGAALIMDVKKGRSRIVGVTMHPSS